MWYVLVAIIALVAGAAAIWFWKIPEVEREVVSYKRKWLDFKNASESIYSNEFGGYGIRPEMLDEAYNRLWRLLGKQERGRPPR